MSTATNSCGCGCSPCVCTTSTAVGCVADLCVPRPCFFNGQLIGADDLNAVVSYFRTKEAMLARFVSGWGILGGLKLGATPGARAVPLSTDSFSPNPQIIAGTIAQISAGAGIDAAGRTLALCEARTVDLATLVSQPVAPMTQDCSTWFQGTSATVCDDNSSVTFREDGAAATTQTFSNSLTATSYWLVAQYVETPSRPVPQFSGGGACDPAPSCNFSRRIEDIQLSLVPALPASYFLTGCLDAITLSVPNAITFPSPVSTTTTKSTGATTVMGSTFTQQASAITQALFAKSISQTLLTGNPVPITTIPTTTTTTTTGTTTTTTSTSGQQSTLACVNTVYSLIDAITSQLTGACCTTPALVLGQVLFTSNPGNLPLGSLSPNAPVYTVLLDAYPYRRVIAPAALDLFLLAELACSQNQQQQPQPTPTVVAAGIVGVSDFNPNNASAFTPAPVYPPGASNPYLIVGNLQAFDYDPSSVTTNAPDPPTQVNGKLYVTFNGYTMPTGSNTYVIKAMVRELAVVDLSGIDIRGPVPASVLFSVAFDSFQPASIALTVMVITTTTTDAGTQAPSVPTPVLITDLANLYFEIEVTSYPT